MKMRIWSLGTVALALMASSSANADPHFNVDINPFGWGAPPPVVYESPRYYAPPPVVYGGDGRWGGDSRGRSHDRGHSEHRADGRADGDRRR